MCRGIVLELGDGEVGRAYPRPAVWTMDIQEKYAIALIRQTFEIRLDCTIKQALQGCRQPRTVERMRTVGGCSLAGMPAAIAALEEIIQC